MSEYDRWQEFLNHYNTDDKLLMEFISKERGKVKTPTDEEVLESEDDS